MKKQTTEIILFVLNGCGFCVKAQKILESEIKEGRVEIKPHTDAKGLKWARGFPCLVRLKDGKGVLGCPNSFADLMEKLDKSDITLEKMELSKFNKIKLPPKMKAAQRKSIVPMKNKEHIKHVVNHDNKEHIKHVVNHDNKEHIKSILKKKGKALPSKPKSSKEGFMKIAAENAGPSSKIMFYSMMTCPYCRQAQTMLDEHIRKGIIMVIPHTEAPKDVTSFPYFSWNNKNEYGLPKSPETLFEKLGYKQENFIIRQEEKNIKTTEEENEIIPEESKEFFMSYKNMKFASYTKHHPKHNTEVPKHMLGVL